VSIAKSISGITKLPLPRVAQILQKYPLETGGKINKTNVDKALTECQNAAAVEMRKLMDKLF
jgi:hypothetical protein